MLSFLAMGIASIAFFAILAVLAKRPTPLILFGLLWLGIDAGLILGLSSSPIISAVLASAFTLAGVVIPLFLAKTAPAPAAVTNMSQWIVPLGPGLFLGIVFGVFLRVNDSLFVVAPPKPDNLKERYKAMGFDDRQVNSIMERFSSEVKLCCEANPPAPSPAQAQPAAAHTGLLNAFQHGSFKEEFKKSLQLIGTPEAQLNELKKNVPADARAEIEKLESSLKGTGKPTWAKDTLDEIGRQVGKLP